MNQLLRALYISRKDTESYYGKPPLITWGLLFPAVLVLAMYIKDPGNYLVVCPGVIAMTLLFGNTSMAAMVITFEKRCGTFQRLLLAPVDYRTIILGKAVGAAVYGVASSLVLTLGLIVLLGMPLEHPLFFAVYGGSSSSMLSSAEPAQYCSPWRSSALAPSLPPVNERG